MSARLDAGHSYPKTAATCWEVLAREAALWTFASREGVEPTKNVAERYLRHAVPSSISSVTIISPRMQHYHNSAT